MPWRHRICRRSPRRRRTRARPPPRPRCRSPIRRLTRSRSRRSNRRARRNRLLMRRLALALVALLVVATPAFGDDVSKKHEVDSQISSLRSKLDAKRQAEQKLRNVVAGYTSQIRRLEGRVGDVSLKLETMEADLALHQRRLDALNELYSLQTSKFVFLKRQYRDSVDVLNRRLIDIYESDEASTLDIFLGARSVQDAVDQVQYLNEIGDQDRRIARQVAGAKGEITVARAKTKKLRASVHSETAVIAARTAQARGVRDALVGAKNDLAATKQQKLQDISKLSAEEQAEASEIDALQQASNDLAAKIQAAQAGRTSTPSSAGLVWPVQGPVTSPFGWRWGRMHQGID